MYKDKHKLDNISKRECECPINNTPTFSGSFNLECGECLKVFESDEPVEFRLNVVRSSTNDCNILIFVELQNGECLEFEIRHNDISASNEIATITKQARKVTIECKSDSLDGGTCIGVYTITFILRGSETDRRCECPVDATFGDFSSFVLGSNENQVIYQGDEPTEIIMNVDLEPNADECLLTIIVELENCACLKFDIQAPTSGLSNDITFYSKKILKVTLECLTSTNCRGFWNNLYIFRGA